MKRVGRTIKSSLYGLNVLCADGDPERKDSEVKLIKLDPEEMEAIIKRAERKKSLNFEVNKPKKKEHCFEHIGKWRKKKSQAGYTTIIAPIIITLILSFAAFTLDMAKAYLLKHQLQASVDAASLAGASNVTVEFATDEDGIVDLNSTVMKIVEDSADADAEYYFDQNVSLMKLADNGVRILNKKGETKSDQLHYSYEVTADVPMNLAGPFLGTGSRQRVYVYAEAVSEE